MTILQYHFGVQDGFSHRPEYYNSRKGFTDVTSVKWIQQLDAPPPGVAPLPADPPPANAPPPGVATLPANPPPPANPQPEPPLVCRPFLITQTKAARYQNRKSEWRRGEDQLRRYLQEFDDSARHRRWFWGILAIGRLVRFFRYDRHSGMMEMIQIRAYDVEKNATDITNILEEIKRGSH